MKQADSGYSCNLTSTCPYLNIDSSILLNSNFYSLRATLQLKGRGITVYETVYTQKENGSLKLYKRFLNELKCRRKKINSDLI